MESRFKRFLNKFSQYIIIKPPKRESSKEFQDWIKQQGISSEYRSFDGCKNLKPFKSMIIWEIPSQKDLFLDDINSFLLNNIEYIGGYVNKSLVKFLQKEIYNGKIKPIGYFGDKSKIYPGNFWFLKIKKPKIEEFNLIPNPINKELEIFIPDNFKKENFIFFTLINQGYLDYFLNFYVTLRKLNIHRDLLPITIDTKSHIFLLKTGIFNVYFDTTYTYHKHDINKKGNWVIMMFNKMTLNYILIKSGFLTLYSDADIIFKKNPIPKIKNYMRKYEIITQNDKFWYSPEDFNMICAGFMAVKPTENTLRLLNPSKINLNDFIDDQTYINNTYNNFDLKILFLPISEYPNGSHYYHYPRLYDKTAYVIHFNHCVGDVRRWKMIEAGYWVIKEFSKIEKLFFVYNKIKKKDQKIINKIILTSISLLQLLYKKRIFNSVLKKALPPLKILERNLKELNMDVYTSKFKE